MFAPTQSQSTTQSLAQAPMSQADADRKRQITEAWKAYRGDFPPSLKVSADQPNDNVIANFCNPIVTKGTSFLFGQVLKIACNDQKFVDGLWGDDDTRMTLFSEMSINGGVCGEVFLKLIPAQGLMKYPRIVVMDPSIVRVVTAPDDCSLTLAYIIEYPSSNDFQKRQVVARVDPDSLAGVAGEYDLDDSWTITNYIRKGQAGAWYQIGEREVWPWPFAPIFCCKNLPNPNEVWGMPDLSPDLIDQNKTLNFLLSTLARIVKYHGHPKTWAKGLNASQITIGVDDLICLPSIDSALGVLTPMDNFTGILSIIANIMSNIDQQSRTPAVALGRLVDLPKGNLSGVALELLFQPLTEKTMQKRRPYGCLIRDVSRAALVVAGLLSLEQYEDYVITLHWPDLLPVDDLAAAQTGLLLQQLGVSQDTILQKMGYDPGNEARKSALETARKPMQQPMMPPIASTPAGE